MPRRQRQPRLSEPALRVLRVLLDDPLKPMYGLDLMDQTGVKSGTLYPMLARLAEAGWLIAEREQVDPAEVGRPPRTYYRLSADGATGAADALNRLAVGESDRTGLGWAVS